MSVDPRELVGQIVARNPASAGVLAGHGIDPWGEAELSLAEAAAGAGARISELGLELEGLLADHAMIARVDASSMDGPELARHVVETHHGYLRRALPAVTRLSAHVRRVHGANDLRLVVVDQLVGDATAALLAHLQDEDAESLPALLASDEPARAGVDVGAIRAEHEAIRALFARIRAATGGYSLPGWACGRYRALFGELEAIEGMVLDLVALENDVLLPRLMGARPPDPAR